MSLCQMSLCLGYLAVAREGRRTDQPPVTYLRGGPPPTSEPTPTPAAAETTPEQVAKRLIDDLVQAALFLDEWDASEALTMRSVPKRSARGHQRPQRPASGAGAEPVALFG